MKIFINLFILICLVYFNYSLNLENFDYTLAATKILEKYSKRITGVQGKTNKTKCYAKTDIKVNDTIFKYDKKEILSSETCFHPQKEEIFKNATSYTNDTYEQNKMLLVILNYYLIFLT